MKIWEETPCEVCGKPFTEQEWGERHSTEGGGECHPQCCEVCSRPDSLCFGFRKRVQTYMDKIDRELYRRVNRAQEHKEGS